MIRLDAGTRTVVATCAACPSWRELRGTRPAAQLEAARHLELVHGAKRRARELRELATRATRPK